MNILRSDTTIDGRFTDFAPLLMSFSIGCGASRRWRLTFYGRGPPRDVAADRSVGLLITYL